VIGPVVIIITAFWSLATMVVAVRQALDYDSTPRAILVLRHRLGRATPHHHDSLLRARFLQSFGRLRTCGHDGAERPAYVVATLPLILLATVALASTVGADDDDNLGQRIVRGRVYNLDRGEGVPIASATISFRNLQGSGPDASGLAVTDVNGSFAFAITLRSGDIVRLTASAPGFEPFTTSERADQLVGRNPAIEIGLGEPSPGRHRVRGHLAMGAGCAFDAPQRAGPSAPLRPAGAQQRQRHVPLR
jgi:hypothetical protein